MTPLEALVAAAEALQSSVNVGLDPAPFVLAMRDFVVVDPYGASTEAQPLAPRAGDLLVETSSTWSTSGQRVGVLMAIRRAHGRYDDCWTLRRIDGEGDVTWQNASFVRIPVTPEDRAWIHDRAQYHLGRRSDRGVAPGRAGEASGQADGAAGRASLEFGVSYPTSPIRCESVDRDDAGTLDPPSSLPVRRDVPSLEVGSVAPDRLAEELRQCAARHGEFARSYERGGNASGAAELRRVENLLWALIRGEPWVTVLPEMSAPPT